jgi:hypothetical protein
MGASSPRALAELTVRELAEAANTTTRTISRLEVNGAIRVAERKRHAT